MEYCVIRPYDIVDMVRKIIAHSKVVHYLVCTLLEVGFGVSVLGLGGTGDQLIFNFRI